MSLIGIAEARDALRAMLSESATFQTWTGVGSAAAALARIHEYAVEKPTSKKEYTLAELADLRPYAVIREPAEDLFAVSADEAQDVYMTAGVLTLKLEEETPALDQATPGVAEKNFTDTIDGIMGDLRDQAVVSGASLNFERMELVEKRRAHQNIIASQGDWQAAMLRIVWDRGV